MIGGKEADVSEKSIYQRWLEREGLPVIREYYIQDIRKVPLEPWERKGGRGAYLNLIGTGEANDAYICEIPAGKSLKPQRHLFEEMIFIVEGRGAISVWTDKGKKQTFEWQFGSLFSPPLNTWHQHFNGSGSEPVRYLALRWGSKKYRGLRKAYGVDEDVKKGGSQIEYGDEEPKIHREFEEAAAKARAACRMGEFHPLCSHKPVAKAV